MRESPIAGTRGRTGSLALLVAATALVMTTGTALAANSFEIDCAGRDGNVSHLDELDITVVDLKTGDETALDDELLSGDDLDSSTPILNLGPRVATIVRDVFGDSEAEIVKTNANEAATVRSATLAPLAGSSDAKPPAGDALDSGDEHSDNRPYSPLRVHREMYRTDI